MSSNDQAFDYAQCVEINNIPTEFVCHKFQNKIFLLITQLEKISNLYTVRNQVFNDPSMMSSNSTQIFDIQQKFGAPSIETEAGIRFLMNFISQTSEMVICLAVKNNKNLEREELIAIKDALLQIPLFAK
ncbi:unnamed protein product [Diamesa hyperborea]